MQVRTDDLTWRKVENDIIVLDLRRSVYLRLNPTGAVLWERLIAGEDENALANTLVGEHGATPDQASRDVSVFLEQLRRSDLLS